MPARSKIDQLPPEIRQEFEKKLITDGFRNYADYESWFAERGFEISRSAAHRFGQDFQERCQAIRVATEQAKAIVTVVGDDEGNMNEALIRLIQQLTFDILINIKDADISDILPKIGVMVAKLSKASVDQKKYVTEVKGRANKAADEVVTAVKKGGMSEATAEEIRKKILGIV